MVYFNKKILLLNYYKLILIPYWFRKFNYSSYKQFPFFFNSMFNVEYSNIEDYKNVLFVDKFSKICYLFYSLFLIKSRLTHFKMYYKLSNAKSRIKFYRLFSELHFSKFNGIF